ncbi:MAG: aldo/keto reductase [Deltaproteobacteria bacterium]
MEHIRIPRTNLEVSRVALGTWAIGGWMWGGTDEARSIATIHAALDREVNLVDTAPAYGFGTSEEIVGKALEEYGGRERLHISTKAGLAWHEGRVFRNGSRDRIMREVEDSLTRLRTDYLDIYFVHWPDPTRPMAETASAMLDLYEEGTVRAVGVSNFTPDQMDHFRSECPLHLCQPPYNIFERSIETDIKPYCERHNIALMTYGVLCRGMLSGRMRQGQTFGGDDLRQLDPKFREPRLGQYLTAVAKLEKLAHVGFGRSLVDFSVRWVLEKGVPITIWGGRRPEQVASLDRIFGWSLDGAALSAVDSILAETIKDPAGPEFMAPPTGLEE